MFSIDEISDIFLYGYNVMLDSYTFISLSFIITILLLDLILYYSGKILFKKVINKKYNFNGFNNICLYTYVFRFIPFGGFIGSFLSGINNKKNIIDHILLSYILFIMSVFFITIFIGSFSNDLAFSRVKYNVIHPIITFITLFLIGIFGTIGYYLGKIKK